MKTAMPSAPERVADLEADLKAARGERALLTVAYKAIQRVKQWERYDDEKSGRDQPGKQAPP